MLSPGQRPAATAAPRSWNGRRVPHRPSGRFTPSGRAVCGSNVGDAASRSVGDTVGIRPRPAPTRPAGNLPLVTYTRGRDLSGSLAGAGGIGGLLARSHGYSGGNWTYHNAYHADGNGTVTALVNGSGVLQAGYRYDPFGRYLNGGGTLATANVLRFSSKPWVGFAGSTTSGLYYYGYRFYDPYLQRWVNRDPIKEPGFNLLIGSQGTFHLDEAKNLYAFVQNDPLYSIDNWGLVKKCPECKSQWKAPLYILTKLPILKLAVCESAFKACNIDCAVEYGEESNEKDSCLEHCFDDCWKNYLACLSKTWKPRPKPSPHGSVRSRRVW